MICSDRMRWLFRVFSLMGCGPTLFITVVILFKCGSSIERQTCRAFLDNWRSKNNSCRVVLFFRVVERLPHFTPFLSPFYFTLHLSENGHLNMLMCLLGGECKVVLILFFYISLCLHWHFWTLRDGNFNENDSVLFSSVYFILAPLSLWQWKFDYSHS